MKQQNKSSNSIIYNNKKPTNLYMLITFILIFTILFSGCWNYREVNEMLPVVGAAIDKKDGEYIITIETLNPSLKEESKLESNVVSASGKTVFDAIRNAILIGGKKLYWSHAKVLIVSEEIAKNNMVSVLDFVSRDQEMRTDLLLLVSVDESAKDILLEQEVTHNSSSFHLYDMIQEHKNISKFYPVELLCFLNAMSSEGISATAPTAKIIDNGDNSLRKITGTAIFKKENMIGHITETETNSFLIVLGELHGGLLVIENISETGLEATLEIYKSKTKLKPLIVNNELTIKINVEIEVGIAEISSQTNLINKEGREILKKEAEKQIKERVNNVIKKVQNEYNSDIFGFGKLISKEMPSEWKKIKDDWDNYFKDLKTTVDIEIEIKGSALVSEPIKVSN